MKMKSITKTQFINKCLLKPKKLRNFLIHFPKEFHPKKIDFPERKRRISFDKNQNTLFPKN